MTSTSPSESSARAPSPASQEGSRSAVAIAIVLVASLFGGGLVFLIPVPTAQAANVSLTLYGNAATGWSFTPGGGTNPGPPISVGVGDSVTVHLIAEDSMPHAFFVDLDDDFRISAGDILSNGGTDVTYTFTVPLAPGSHYYYCSLHSTDMYSDYRPGAPMYGLFIVYGPPSATFAAPIAGTSWTGGLPHDVRFSLTNGEPPTSLTLWVNYSSASAAQSGPIAGPIPGTANPNIVSWTPPIFDAADVIVNVTARNSTGAVGYSLSAPFELDSTPPTITGRTPAPNDVDVPLNGNIRVTWSERMNTAASGAPDAFAVQRLSDGLWISGTASWSPDARQMTFTPSAPWDATTTHVVHVNGTAKDGSAPGNAVAAPATWQFTTGTFSDTTPPAVLNAAAIPSVQNVGGTVVIQANVTDDLQVATVSAHVQGPSTDVNLTMTNLGGPTWSVVRTYTAAGSYTFTVWAIDASGNANSRTGTFSIASGPMPAPSAVTTELQAGAGNAVAVAWSAVTHPVVIGYNVYRSGTAGGPYTKLTTSPVAASGPLRFVDTSVEPGRTYYYVVTSVDANGNESPFSEESTITIAPGSTLVPSDYTPWLIAAIVAIGILLAVIVVLRRRRHPGDPPK